MENTLENKARFFAQYWGQIVMQDKISQELRPSNIRCFTVDRQIDTTSFQTDSYLLLTPLSSISDEDAIEVSRSYCVATENTHYEFTPSEMKEVLTRECLRLPAPCVDYLRSKGYALPYLDASVSDLENMGWIKLKK